MKTQKIFDLDAYIKNKDVKVLSCKKSEREGYENYFEVITDSTIFSPEGGGQKSDVGFFDDIEVKDVQEFDGEIIHFLSDEVKEGSSVKQSIDFDLRFKRMQNHNAEHLICGLIHKRFGYENVGFHLSETLDENGMITHIEAIMDVNGPITPEELSEIEKEANKAISENVPIYALLPTPDEAKDIFYRSKLDISENLRLVIIEGYDSCACCAPCLKSSSEIQLVKILDFMPHRGGMRLTLIAGLYAIEDYIRLHDENKKIMKMLSCERNASSDAVSGMVTKCEAYHEETNSLKNQVVELFKEKLSNKLEGADAKFEILFAPDLDEVQSRKLINETAARYEALIGIMFSKKENTYRFVVGKNEKLTDISLTDIAKKMRESLQARGGGSEQMIQGSVSASEEEIYKFFEETING